MRNAIRALRAVAPDGNLRNIPNVVLVGGSAEDFEIPEMLMEALADYRIVCGRGNIRGSEGPRNAVATGLLLSYLGNQEEQTGKYTGCLVSIVSGTGYLADCRAPQYVSDGGNHGCKQTSDYYIL